MGIPRTIYPVCQMPDNNQPVNPYVFIVGSPRSGTTLLQRVVDAHPDVAIFHEMWWIVQWYERRIGLTPDATATPELVSHLAEHRKFRRRLRMGRKELERVLPPLLREAGEPVSYARFMSGVFDLYGEAEGKRLVGDKTPEYVQNIPTLHHLWPEARFVHLIRDGRDVCLSVTNWDKPNLEADRLTTREDPVSALALWWEWHVQLGCEAGESLGPGLYHEVRYEYLVSQPAEECAKLCEFLDIPYNDAMLRFHQDQEREDPGLDAKKAWRPVTSGLRDWRSQMPAEDVKRFEAVAGDLLDELGYERAVESPSAEKLEHAVKIREAFGREVRGRGERLPERW